MHVDNLERKEVVNFIKEVLYKSKLEFKNIDNAKFHHNAMYEDGASICQYGILTISDLNKLGLKKYSDEDIKILGDIESHINGYDKVSLSIIGLTDLYKNEFEYNPCKADYLDLLISSEIVAGRHSFHYGNEFLHLGSIGNDKIKSIDIRLLDLINIIENSNGYSTDELIKKYNYLKDIIITLKKLKLNIPIREMSLDNNFLIDKNILMNYPKLMLKKGDLNE